MVRNSATLFSVFTVALIWINSVNADAVDFVVDSTQSFTEVSIQGGAAQTSQTSGTGRLVLSPSSPPFGVAQISELNLIWDDNMTFSFLGGAVTANTVGGDVMTDMITPGPAGTVVGGQFDQFGNLMGLSGNVEILDPFGLIGGDQNFDLSTLAPGTVDFVGISLVRVGDTVTLDVDYEINQILDVSGNPVTLDIVGTLVASGSVPEPGATLILLGSSVAFLTRRRR